MPTLTAGRRRAPLALAVLLTAASLSTEAAASCGAAFCTVNTNWNTQTPLTEPGTRVDLRFEFIDQDQPRRGNRDISVGEIPRHHDEVRTINRNLSLTVDHNFDANWGVTVTVPLVDRRHEHFHHHGGAVLRETWDFTELGDIRLLGRYQFQGAHPATNFGILAGVKLPTGDFTVRNDDGALAERTLQPGTGTTDGLVGAFYHDTLPIPDSAWFTQFLFQHPLYERAGFRPGYQAQLDLGYVWNPLPDLALMLQLNTTRKGRDSGPEAERADSGSWTVALSPGASVAVLDNVRLFGFVQIPVYQYVSGVQLVADWAGVVGISTSF